MDALLRCNFTHYEHDEAAVKYPLSSCSHVSRWLLGLPSRTKPDAANHSLRNVFLFFCCFFLSCWISREATTKHFALVSLFFLFGFSNHWKNFFFLFNKTLSHVQQFFCTIETRRKKLLRPDGFTFTFLLLSFSIDVHLACFAKTFFFLNNFPLPTKTFFFLLWKFTFSSVVYF